MANVWQKAFQRIFWKNRPDTSSPLGESKLLPMDASIDTIDDRVVTLQSTKAEQSDFLTAIKSVTYDKPTGVFTITKFNDSYTTIDTDTEKIPVTIDYDDNPTSPYYQNFIITLEDGTVKYADMSALITEYEFGNTTTINFTVSSSTGIVTANVINGSITSDHLAPSVMSGINVAVASAEAHAEDSEAWARGTKDGTPVPSTADQYQNNSKYYSELSDGSAEDSEAYAKGTRNGTAVSSDDPAYHNNAKYWSDQAVATLNNKVDKEAGKGLSSNDFTNALKDKLDGIEAGAEVNVQSDWSQSDNTSDDYIKNKPTIPTVNDGTLTIKQNGTTVGTFSANQSGNTEVDITGGGGTTYTEGDGIDISAQNVISVDTTFSEASTRANIASGDTFATILGKIKKWFTDLPNMFVSKSDGGTFNGNVIIDRQNGTTSNIGYSRLYLGNSIASGTDKNSVGIIELYTRSGNVVEIYDHDGGITESIYLALPNKSGTIALTSDVDTKVSRSGDTMTGALTMNASAEVQAVFNRSHSNTTSQPARINIGNSTADGTAGSSYGKLRLYGKGSSYTDLQAPNATSSRTITLPDKGGTVALERGSYSIEYTNQKWIDILSDFWSSRIDKTKLTLFSRLHAHISSSDDKFFILCNSNCMNVSSPSYATFVIPIPGNGRNEVIYFDNSSSLNSFKKYVYNGNVDTDYSQDTVSVTLTMYY